MSENDYIEMLEKNYQDWVNDPCVGGDDYSKLEHLGNEIFDFTTYDGEMDEMLAKDMLEVLEAILYKDTFHYIENEKNYKNYIIMVNMPFLYDKISWGTSIRGTFIDSFEPKKSEYIKIASGAFSRESEIIIKRSELVEFLTGLIKWSKI
jgi:hypothetical protein